MAPTRRRAQGAWLVLGVLVVAGGAARWTGHHGSSLWFDEVITLEEATRPSLGETVRAKAMHPPLIRVAARLSLRALGDPADPRSIDLALRLPSLLMGTAAIVMVFLFARAYADGDALVGLLAAAAWALLPYGITHSAEARFYASLTLFTAWSLYALARFQIRQRPIDHVHLALPLALGCYTHYLFAFVFLLTATTVAPPVLADPRRRWTRLLPWAIAGALFLPWLAFAVTLLRPQEREWVAPLAQQLRDVPVSFFTGRFGYHHLRARDAVLGGAAILLALGVAIHLVRRRGRLARLTMMVLLPSLALTACLHAARSETPFFHPKYLAFVYPFACLGLGELGAYGARWARAPLRGGAAAPFVLALALAAVVPVGRALGEVYGRTLRGQRQPYEAAARWIAARREPGERLVVLDCSRRYNALALRHYGVRAPLTRLRCHGAGASLPPAAGARTLAVLTHWGDEGTREAALDALRARYGRVAERARFRGVDADVVVLALSAQGEGGGASSSGGRPRSSACSPAAWPASSDGGSARRSPGPVAANPSAPSHITYPRS